MTEIQSQPENESRAETPATRRGKTTLAIDIGGTGIKLMILDAKGAPLGERLREPTPRPATPQAILAQIQRMMPTTRIDRVSAGFPGVVKRGVVHTAPNLHPSWAEFDLQKALTELTSKPARVLNDAGVQGHGAVTGQGVEAVLTLGTGMGFALFVDGTYVPNIELAHHPLRKKMTYEQYIGNEARLKTKNQRWSKRVARVLASVQRTFNPDRIFIGGGNSSRLKIELPANVKLVDNVAGLLGGIALWRE